MLGKFSVKKPYTVLVAVVLVIVLGIVSFTRMSTDLLPSISLPYVIVMTPYPGASPETVEMAVTKPVESSMATVSNVEGITSISSENYSMVVLEFSQTTDMNSVSLEIRENLDQIKSYWDDSIGSPIIMKLNPDMLPVMIAAVGGNNMTMAEVTQMTENIIIPELESIEGVASASATGLLEESINVVISQEKIDKINEQVFGSIDKQMEETQADLEESKQEVYDGQKDLEDARKELQDSEQELADNRADLDEAQKELEDSKTELANGRAELANNKDKITQGKAELEKQKEESKTKLAAAETEIITAKADLEALKVHLTAEIATAQATIDAYDKLEAGIAECENGINELTNLLTMIDGMGNGGTFTAEESAALIQLLDKFQLSSMIDTSVTGWETAAKTTLKTAIETQRTSVQAQKDALEAQRDSMASTVAMNKQAIAAMQGQLQEANANIEKLDAALQELYKGNLTAAVELANAQTTLSVGELQISSAESQLDAAESQIESGEEQIKSGYEQLDAGADQIADGYKQLEDSAEQLSDALQQILDGEEELQDAWDNAYDQADMNGVLTVEMVENLLTAQNFSMPAGYVTEDGISYLIRVGDKPEDIDSLKSMPILNLEMDDVDVITLGDVADIFMVDNSADIYTNVNGTPGIMISMQKQTGYSTGDVSDKILAKFDELLAENEDLLLITLMDQGVYIDLVMDSIINNILFGAVLAILILILFLKDIRPTAVIACSIPISLITAIVCMYFSGVTLNVISLSGLALGIGMLVDNSIVVIENIYRMRHEGMSSKEAAIQGTSEVAGAIVASTLTTVCVFLPIVFTEGITRQLFVDMGLTIAYSLGASLLVALTVVPAMASKTLRKTKEQKEGRFFAALTNGYQKVLKLALKYKPVVLILVIVLLIVSAIGSYAKGTAFMPEMDSTQMTMSVSLPKDTPLSHTSEVGDEIVDRLLAMEDVVDVGAMASTSSMAALTGSGDAATNAVDIYISLKEDKKKSNKELSSDMMELLEDICTEEEVEISIETSSMDMSALGGSGISIQVQGRDLDTLQELAKKVATIVEGVEGTQNVSDGLEETTGELRIIIDRDKAMEHGLTVAQIYQQIAAKLAEATSATTLETTAEDYDIYVKHEGDMALTRSLVENLVIERTKQDGTKEKVNLRDMASFENTVSPNAVNRSDQNRYIGVTAEIADGYNIGLVSDDLEVALQDLELPEGYRIVMSGENEMINDAMQQIYLMMLLAVIFMYLIMVAQFQSLLSPFIILFTIPLAFTGGFLGLLVSGSELSVIAMIGFVMLAGIIVNNGIVLVDYTNQLRAEGMEKREALLNAGRTRIRPVLMTALTTILALCTMVFSKDMGSEMARPMAVVTIGGLVYGTLLTLIVIPCVYDMFNRDKKKKVTEEEADGIDETIS